MDVQKVMDVQECKDINVQELVHLIELETMKNDVYSSAFAWGNYKEAKENQLYVDLIFSEVKDNGPFASFSSFYRFLLEKCKIPILKKVTSRLLQLWEDNLHDCVSIKDVYRSINITSSRSIRKRDSNVDESEEFDLQPGHFYAVCAEISNSSAKIAISLNTREDH